MTVSGGTSVSIATGTTVTADNVNLKSTSDKFSSLMLDGDLLKDDAVTPTVVNYDRYVNVVGSASNNGGNDLISLPVKTADATFGDLLTYSADGGTTPNSSIIVNNPDPSFDTVYAFGPYSNSAGAYINYDEIIDGTVLLERGMGYRAATNNGETIRFTGTVSKADETVAITTTFTGADYNYWNTVGNPYPTYINAQVFYSENKDQLDVDAQAIYAYNSGTGSVSGFGTFGNFTIINDLTNETVNIAPGQGFLVAVDRDAIGNEIVFTQAMRVFSGTDDFILGRSDNQSQKLRLKAEQGSTNFATEIYFNDNATLGLDPGYDAGTFNGISSNFMIYSHLVEGNTGRNMAIQSLASTDMNDVIIPLGLKTAQGQQVTISIENSTLPAETQVYLEDNQSNTFTLLNSGDYTFTANTAISGTGRFFLRMGTATLSTPVTEANALKLFTTEQTLFIKGQLLAETQVSVYDIQGRLVLTSILAQGSDSNNIDASGLNTGIYIVKLNNEKQELTKKVIIK